MGSALVHGCVTAGMSDRRTSNSLVGCMREDSWAGWRVLECNALHPQLSQSVKQSVVFHVVLTCSIIFHISLAQFCKHWNNEWEIKSLVNLANYFQILTYYLKAYVHTVNRLVVWSMYSIAVTVFCIVHRLKGYVAGRRGEREDMQDAHTILDDFTPHCTSLSDEM